MEKKQICTIFLFQFKLGRKAAETARDINEAFGPGTTTERTGGLRNFVAATRVLKMMSVVVGHRILITII